MPLLFLETLILLFKAAIIRRRGRASLRLPAVAATALAPGELRFLVSQVNRLTSLLAGKSRHACWYRSYPLAVLLRKRGVAAQLNIGLMGLQPRQELRGHCWLSIAGRVFNEPEAASSLSYPEFLGEGSESGQGVLYWVNVDGAKAVRSRSAL